MALNSLAGCDLENIRGDNSLVRALIEFSLDSLKNDAPVINQGKSFSSWKSIVEYININCNKPISRASIADNFHFSHSYVSVLCNKFTGKSFNDYLKGIKMQRAAMLLTESDLILDEIADLCGFRYTSYFIRVFQNYYGISPTKYRYNTNRKTFNNI